MRRTPRIALSLGEIQRARILGAMSAVLDVDGVERASVTRIVEQARVPRAAFYQHFLGRDDALRVLVAGALERSRTAVLEAGRQETSWQGRTRAGLEALLALYEAQPEIGRLCLTHSRAPDARIRRLREQALEQLAGHVAGGASRGRQAAGALGPHCTVAGVLAILETRVAERPRPALTHLAGELMSFTVLPYRGAAAARDERMRPSTKITPRRRAVEDPMPAGLRITYRTMRVLGAIAANPGASNIEVGEHAGIVDQGQISKLLKRLQALGLAENTGSGPEHGGANAWWLTADGEKAEHSILNHHMPARP